MTADPAGNVPTLSDALTTALGTAVVKPQDMAAVALARSYAAQVDGDADLLPKLGPLFLAVLDALAMTPRGRVSVLARTKGAPGDVERNGAGESHTDDCQCLPCLRSRRAARVHGPAVVDTATS